MKTVYFTIPVLFVFFNRKNTACESFKRIRNAKPAKLYLAQDGARKDKCGEDIIVKETREAILSMIDWDCEVKTQFREENLGCGIGPATAITWFFDNVEQGIILEDDCIPDPSFFPYVQELLYRYKDDTRVMEICGTNRLNTCNNDGFSYFFTNCPSEWGWASWRRAWKMFDFEMKSWLNKNCQETVKSIYGDKYYRIEPIHDETVNNPGVSWWDYQWGYAKNINSGLSITPCKNLISNVGFDENATHTFDVSSPFCNLPRHEMNFPLVHPESVTNTIVLDKLLFDVNFPPLKKPNKIKRTFLWRLLSKVYHVIFRRG